MAEEEVAEAEVAEATVVPITESTSPLLVLKTTPGISSVSRSMSVREGTNLRTVAKAKNAERGTATISRKKAPAISITKISLIVLDS